MQSNTKPIDLFSMWTEISKLKFELEGSCASCGGDHPVHKCKDLCLLKGCILKYMDISDKHYHQLKDCKSPEHKICSRCNKGGHLLEDCRVPQCHYCGVIGHVRPNCKVFIRDRYQNFLYQEMYGQIMYTTDLSMEDRHYAPMTLEQDRKTAVFPSEPVTKWRHDPYSFTSNIVYD
jgi:hypothetical protein